MLNLSKIERLVEAGRFEDLLRAVTDNGRQLPLPIQLRLSIPEDVELAGLGLGLQRACELAYGPSPMLADLADRLSGAMVDDAAARPHAGAVASAMSGLLAFRAHAKATKQAVEPMVRARVEQALRHGAYAVFEAQSASGVGLIGDTIDAAILLWHLAEPLGLRDVLEKGGGVRLDEFEKACQRTGIWKDSTVQQVVRLSGVDQRGVRRGQGSRAA